MITLNSQRMVDEDYLAYEIVGGADGLDDVFELVTRIDEHCVNWEFTERLYQHFKAQHKEYKRITKED